MGVISEEITADAQDDGGADAPVNPDFSDGSDPFSLDYEIEADNLPVSFGQVETGLSFVVGLRKLL